MPSTGLLASIQLANNSMSIVLDCMNLVLFLITKKKKKSLRSISVTGLNAAGHIL